MSTATVPIAITCPDWCIVEADAHAADLWEMGGNCIHRGPDVDVVDTTGYQEPLQSLRLHQAIRLQLTAMTRPDGAESATPVIYIGEREHSIQQALDLAEAIKTMVETYRAAGGTE